MRRLQCALLATVAAIGFTSVASAADMPTKAPAAIAPYNWTGWYIGANAGYAWGKSNATFSNDCNVTPGLYCGGGVRNADANAIQASGNGSLDPNGFTGGIQAGVNWQNGNIVYGLEADFNSFNLDKSRSVTAVMPVSGFTYTIGSSIDTDWLITARGRLGWATSNNMMLYVTGGLAMTKLKVSQSYNDNVGFPPGFTLQSSSSQTKTGWTIGAGSEWMLTRNWSMKAEYLYMKFGNVSTTGNPLNTIVFPGFTTPHTTSVNLQANIVRLGVNYKLSP